MPVLGQRRLPHDSIHLVVVDWVDQLHGMEPSDHQVYDGGLRVHYHACNPVFASPQPRQSVDPKEKKM